MKHLIYLYITLSAGSVTAADWTFEDALRKMKLRHPSLAAAESQTESARSRTRYADALPDPSFSVARFIEPVQTRTGPQETVFKLQQPLPWFGVRESQKSAAMAETEYLTHRERVLSMELSRALAAAFYEYAFLAKATTLTEENLRLLRELDPVVETKVAAGGNLNALLRLKVESGKLEDQLISLKAKRVTLSAKLDALLDEPRDTVRPWPKWDAGTAATWREIQPPTLQADQNPELLAQKAKIARAAARERLVSSQSAPTFSVGINYIQLGDPEVNPATPDAGEDPWSVQASIRIPLWRGAEDAKQQEAARAREAEEHRTKTVQREVRAELEGRRALHADAVRKLTLYGDELLGLARQAVENSRAEYENGKTSILELIDSERSLLALELDYWRAAADAHIHYIHILTLNHSDIDALVASEESP